MGADLLSHFNALHTTIIQLQYGFPRSARVVLFLSPQPWSQFVSGRSFVADDDRNRFARRANRRRCEIPSLRRATNPPLIATVGGWRRTRRSLSLCRSFVRALNRPPARVAFRSSHCVSPCTRV
uniref:Uncharacterized protein n=1 Tax=Plectus sambesii TaxID=2011161 RepID=A0A914VMM1_9BILA